MTVYDKPLRIVLTGPPGSGKTTLIESLRAGGLICIDEPARRVFAAHQDGGRAGRADAHPKRFIADMLALAITDHQLASDRCHPVVFDRGLPDLLGYAAYYRVDDTAIRHVCARWRYDLVLALPPWRRIYRTDSMRTLDFEAAAAFGRLVEAGYRSVRYVPEPLGQETVAARRDEVLARIALAG